MSASQESEASLQNEQNTDRWTLQDAHRLEAHTIKA